MDHDDTPLGRVLGRRETLGILGASGLALLAGSAWAPRHRRTIRELTRYPDTPPACVARPAQTEGPYFVDERLNRSDIRSDPKDGVIKPGIPLALALGVSRIEAGKCVPLRGAQVDIWHCDADGIYSDVTDPHFKTLGQRFFRGYQLTDAAGVARFATIYPGWYPGRTVHIHFKIRTEPTAPKGYAFTSQLYFDDGFTDRVFAKAPYATRGPRTTRNEADEIYPDGGPQLMLAPTATRDGYAATFAIGLKMDG
jgi:protocatechuate 3,4-dioxygenase beta subunit